MKSNVRAAVIVICVIVVTVIYWNSSSSGAKVSVSSYTADNNNGSIYRRKNYIPEMSGLNNRPNWNNNKSNSSSSSKSNNSENRTLKIVFYHPRNKGMVAYHKKIHMDMCFYNNCVLSVDMRDTLHPIDADAVIFQGGRAPRFLPRRRDVNQPFIFYNTQSPTNLNFSKLTISAWNHYYNWSMSHRLDSDIPIPYGIVYPTSNESVDLTNPYDMERRYGNLKIFNDLHSQSDLHFGEIFIANETKNYSEIFNRKSKSAVWLLSDCETTPSKREDYVKELKQYIDVAIFGPCGNKSLPEGEDEILEDFVNDTEYKFYLAFENSRCTDYITEAAFRGFQLDLITVVRGPPTYERHFPRGTYINTDDFSSPRDIALYLDKLGSNEVEYTNMLKKKDNYETIIGEHHARTSAFCHLCRKLNNIDIHRSSIGDLYGWWEKDRCRDK